MSYYNWLLFEIYTLQESHSQSMPTGNVNRYGTVKLSVLGCSLSQERGERGDLEAEGKFLSLSLPSLQCEEELDS